MSAPRDQDLIAILRDRAGRATEVVLVDGRRLTVMNIAWGYDDGDEWAHVTTNISPSVEAEAIDFFFASAVALVVDPNSGHVVFDQSGLGRTDL